jgi:hypothetical protein
MTTLCALAIAAIRAQPYQPESDVDALLSQADDCATPCFLSIQPGITPIDEAMATLRDTRWIDKIDGYMWNWNGNQPSFLNGDQMSFIRPSYPDTDIVGAIFLPTRISTGSFFLFLGKPTSMTAGVDQSYGAGFLFLSLVFVHDNHSAYYVQTTAFCPSDIPALWSSFAYIAFVSDDVMYSDLSAPPTSPSQYACR